MLVLLQLAPVSPVESATILLPYTLPAAPPAAPLEGGAGGGTEGGRRGEGGREGREGESRGGDVQAKTNPAVFFFSAQTHEM